MTREEFAAAYLGQKLREQILSSLPEGSPVVSVTVKVLPQYSMTVVWALSREPLREERFIDRRNLVEMEYGERLQIQDALIEQVNAWAVSGNDER